MSIAPGTPEPNPEQLTMAELRAKVRELLKDRDRQQARADSAEQRLERVEAAHRHVLTIGCDNCKDGRLTLSLGTATDDGKHAAALYGAAITIGWRLGQRTLGILFTSMDRPAPVAFGANDECPACMAKRT